MGDLRAIFDPELPLLLFAEPGAAWWWAWASQCADLIVLHLVLGLDGVRGLLARVLLRWARRQPVRAPADVRRTVSQREMFRCYAASAEHVRRMPVSVLGRAARDIVGPALEGYTDEQRTRALIALARELRGLRPVECEDALVALARLEELIGHGQ